MSARLIGTVCGGPPSPDAECLLWYVIFAVLRTCPRCLRLFEVPITLRLTRTDPIVWAAAHNSGRPEPPGFDHETRVSATAICQGCAEPVTVTDQDISAEVMELAVRAVAERDRETTEDILEALNLRRRQP